MSTQECLSCGGDGFETDDNGAGEVIAITCGECEGTGTVPMTPERAGLIIELGRVR